MSWNFSNLQAVSGNQSALLSWSYDSSANALLQIKQLYVIYTDTDTSDQVNTPTSVAILPILDSSGNLVTNFNLTGLTNGATYLVNIEAHLVTGINSSNTIMTIPSTVPSPQTCFISQAIGGSLTVQLSSSNSQLVQNNLVNSSYDGYSTLTSLYVLYHATGDTSLTTQPFTISSVSDYDNEFTINNLGIADYEVAIKLQNANGVSQYCPPQLFKVTIPIPSAPLNLTATPTMLVDPSFNSYGSSPSITLSWQTPLVLGDPSLNSYQVSRTNILFPNSTQVLATIVRDPSGNLATSYVDDIGLDAGKIYSYRVTSLTTMTSYPFVIPNFAAVLVTALKPPTVTSVTRTSLNASFSLDVSYNANGFLPNQISFDVSGNQGIGLQSFTEEPFNVDNLNNGTTYAYQLRVVGTANNLSFPSNFTNSATAMPYAPLLPVTNFVVNNVDASGSPLNHTLKLTWNYPTNLPSYQSSVTQTAKIYRKLTSSTDASYQLIASVAQPTNLYTDANVLNGSSYTYKIINSQPNSEVETIYSTSVVSTPSIPFTYPTSPQNLGFVDASMA